MGEDLEYRAKDFRERMMGRNLSEKYPLEFSEDGTIIEGGVSSGSDFARFFLKFCGELMVPYFGDKNMIELVKLEIEINPKNKVKLYVAAGICMTAKYALYYTLLDQVF